MSLLAELVTRYTLDPSKYVSGAAKVNSATQSTVGSISKLDQVGSKIGGLASSFVNLGTQALGAIDPLNLLIGVLLAVPVAVIGIGTATFHAGKFAVEAAIEFDTLSRSLTAVVGSADRAKQILSFVDRLAIPSVFESKPLADAALRLEAFGLRAERFLPVVEKLGTVFGGQTQDLMQYASALGFLRGGRFGEGFESLAGAGISRDALKARGLQFDNQGSFKGSIDQALTAVEAEVNARFGGLAQAMADGPAAKMASVMDGFGRGARQAGEVILRYLMPPVEKIGNFVGSLVEGGHFGKLADSLMSAFGGMKLDDKLIDGLAWVVAAIESMPEYMWAWRNAMRPLIYAFNVLGEISARIRGEVWKFVDRLVGGADGVNFYDIVQWRHDKIMKTFRNSMAAGGATNPVDAAIGALGDMGSKSDSFLPQIAANTAETAANTRDSGRYALGGGNLGRLGVSAVEMGALRRPAPVIQLGGVSELETAVHRIVSSAIEQYQRQAYGA